MASIMQLLFFGMFHSLDRLSFDIRFTAASVVSDDCERCKHDYMITKPKDFQGAGRVMYSSDGWARQHAAPGHQCDARAGKAYGGYLTPPNHIKLLPDERIQGSKGISQWIRSHKGE